MQLTNTLLGWLNRVFNKDPVRFLALRVNYDGAMTWLVQDGILTTTISGGSGVSLSIDLSQYTVVNLANFINVQPGYSVPFVDDSANNQLSSLVIVDSSGDQSMSNGDHLFGYTSTLWAYLDAVSVELVAAEASIQAMPAEMSITTADGFWLDFLGGFYGVARKNGEADAQYGPRIIATVLQPRGNNIAIANAINLATGQNATVVDVQITGPGFPLFNGAINYDGSHVYNSSATRLYCLFNVTVGYNILGDSDPTAFITEVTGMLDGFRDAGTHLLSIELTGSTISEIFEGPITEAIDHLTVGPALADTLVTPTEVDTAHLKMAGALVDTLPAPTEADSFGWTYSTLYNGVRKFDGSVLYASGIPVIEHY